MTNDFLIEKFPELSALGFYRVRIILVLMSIFAVLGIYHERLIGLERLWNEWVI
jgi:hypothetical protein